MTTFGCFSSCIAGMTGQSHALGVIGANIANVATGGYKRTETNFQTMLSESIGFGSGSPELPGVSSIQSDLGGPRVRDTTRVSEAGDIVASERDLDLAIGGRGFFVLSGSLDGTGGPYYGRDGSLATAAVEVVADTGAEPSTETRGYLVDKNGYFVQGWPVATDGSVDTSGPTVPMRVDGAAFASVGERTTRASLAMNLPATATPGEAESYDIDVFDADTRQRSLHLAFTKQSTGTWTLTGTGAAGDVVSITPAVAGVTDPLVFGPDGRLAAGGRYAVSVAFADGGSSAFSLDLGNFTQMASDATVFDYTRDGYAPGALSSISVDQSGNVVGAFDNGRVRPLYRLAIADFANPEGLEAMNGNVWAVSPQSGAATIGTAGEGATGRILPNMRELSNVDLATEFSRMMQTQHAYNSSAAAFRTIDEMTETARDLMR